MLGGLSSIPCGGGVPNGAPHKMHAFCGIPGKEGVQHFHVRGRNPINLYSPRALVRVFLLYPGQMGTGQKCSNVGKQRPHLNICAPKPHQRWVPRLYPVPYCPNAFLFRYNVKYERACLTNNSLIRRRNKYFISHVHLLWACLIFTYPCSKT